MLGGFVDSVQAAQLPIRHQLWLVTRLAVEPADMETAHSFVVSVDHSDGTEQLARVEGGFQPQPTPTGLDPEMPLGVPIVVPLFLEFRRVGVYQIRFRFDGDLLWEAPFKVRTLLPQM